MSGEEGEPDALAAMTERETESAFEGLISFGTAGLRAVMGPGSARMNVLTVRLTARALAKTIPEHPETFAGTGVCICYDSRRNSRLFAETCAAVMAEAGIPVLFFGELRPTPEISFAVRHYGCAAGINITASHNPKEYNGLKVYGGDGGQLVPGPAAAVAAHMEEAELFLGPPAVSFEQALEEGKIRILGKETDEAFFRAVLEMAAPCGRIPSGFPIVYTPFHGTGAKVIPEVLRRLGADRLFCVEEQMIPDGDFPTVDSPNPEYKESFRLAERLADRVGADWIIGSDPDADRIAVEYRTEKGTFDHPSFQAVGSVLFEWYAGRLKETGRLPEKPVLMKSIVTGRLAGEVARAQGFGCRETFTGFKYITAEKDRLERNGEGRVVFSFEESYGCMAGDYCRDKDAVGAAALLCCMAADLAAHGMTLGDAIRDCYERYGYWAEKTVSITCTGTDSARRIARVMRELRREPPEEAAGRRVLQWEDMLDGRTGGSEADRRPTSDLKGEDVLRYHLEGGCSILLRPSGTEPKLRIYLSALCSRKDSGRVVEELEEWGLGLIPDP
ncbi:MAG: phospho-sugar mutase [Oscillospiraceae bacterium]|nr:phospho-sugar mutase [Oscillospiraceae bacterium]